jgi:ATP-dependent DNA helicase PIF1
MFLVNAQQRERFFIRLLLLSVRGAKSFEDLRTYNNIIYPSFFEAAKARNLISTDEEWDNCLQVSSTYIFPKAMCELFAYIWANLHKF